VYLRVSPMRGVKRFGIKGKLAPRYIGPFLVLARLGNVAYHLELPPTLTGVHNVFHVSQMKKCLRPPVDVVVDDISPLDADLSYLEHPVKLLDQQDRVMSGRLHGKPRISFIQSIQGFFPRGDASVTSFVSPHYSKSQGEISLRGGGV
jgi:hypothetical protein